MRNIFQNECVFLTENYSKIEAKIDDKDNWFYSSSR